MSAHVGVRELRQNLSKYLARVKRGEAFVVTERGREVARLTPSAHEQDVVAWLVAEHGATVPRGDLLQTLDDSVPPADGPPSEEILAEQREERL